MTARGESKKLDVLVEDETDLADAPDGVFSW